MTELPKEPSIQDLLARIVALEVKNVSLENHVERLYTYGNRLAQQVGGILNDLHTIDPQLFHLMEKNFPGHARAQKQIMDIFNPPDKTGQ